MKNSNDTMNRTRDFLACRAVPQPTAPPRAPRRQSVPQYGKRKVHPRTGHEGPDGA